MKKSKNYIFVIACILASITFSLSSCVDDKESQSVSNIREGHAEKLKAEAALTRAQAEIDKLVAEADIAFKTAETQMKLAEAKMFEAQAAHQAAQTESDKGLWAAQIELAKEDARAIQIKNDKLAKETEYALDQLKLTAETELLELQNALDKLKNTDEVLDDAIEKYSIAIIAVNNAQQEFANTKLKLTKMNALLADNIASVEEIAATDIARFNTLIVDSEENKKLFSQVKSNWELLLSKGNVNAKEEIEKLKKEKNSLIYGKSAELSKVYEQKLKAFIASEKEIIEFRGLGTVNSYGGSSLPGLPGVTYYTVGKLNILKERQEISLESAMKALAEYEKEYAKAEKNLKPNHDALNTASAKEEEAENTYYKVSNDPNSTAQEITDASNALNEARDKRIKASDIYDDTKAIVDGNPSIIANYKDYCTSINSSIENYETAIESYEADSDTPYKLEEAYVKAYEEMDQARVDKNSLWSEIELINEQISEFTYISYGNGSVHIDDIKENIANSERTIENIDLEIASYEKTINRIEADATYAIESRKLEVKALEANIDQLEVKLAAATKQVEVAKKIIDERTK